VCSGIHLPIFVLGVIVLQGARRRSHSSELTASSRASSFAGRPAAADDGGMAQVPGDERCKHGKIAAWCGESEWMAARKGLPVRVWRTPYGIAYRRTPTCQALLEGHRMAERYGREAHPAESLPLSEAMSDLLGECFHCFPENVPADATPCQVLSGAVWVDAFLLEWQRGADGRWKGLGEPRARSRPSRRPQRPSRAQVSWQLQAHLTVGLRRQRGDRPVLVLTRPARQMTRWPKLTSTARSAQSRTGT
jgi:hypothetical protein